MSLALKYLPNYTIEDYTKWKGDWEMIDGIPYAMSPSPNPKHQMISGELFALFREVLKEHCTGDCRVLYEVDWRVNDDTVVKPDLLIVYGEIEGDFIGIIPSLVVEILSPSTHLKDRGLKLELYQEEGVKYYLIADPDKEILQIYELIEGAYVLKKGFKQGAFNFDIDLCKFGIVFSDIWD